MALSADFIPARRGPAATRNEFGYPPAAGAVIYAGALLGLTAQATVKPVGTSGVVAFAGLADRASGTSSVPAQPYVGALKGTWALTVAGATAANVNAPVYATDDNTLTLAATSGSGTNTVNNLAVGTLVGLDNGQTFVSLLGS